MGRMAKFCSNPSTTVALDLDRIELPFSPSAHQLPAEAHLHDAKLATQSVALFHTLKVPYASSMACGAVGDFDGAKLLSLKEGFQA